MVEERDTPMEWIEGSGNIYADLGLADAEEYHAKSELALAIRRIIRARGLTQMAVAAMVGIKQSDVSNIVNGRLDGIGSDRLHKVLNGLEQDVEIVIRPKRAARARTFVRDESVSTAALADSEADSRTTERALPR